MTQPDSFKSPNTNVAIELDPQNDGSIVRKAFLIESILNLTSIPLITNTHIVLSYVLDNPAYINPASILFARLFGGIIVGGLTSALWAGLPNTKTGIESRKVVYLMLGMGEVLLIPILAVEATKGGSKDAALSVRACVATIACLLPPLLWRAFVLFVRPEMMGKYREVKRE
ncbi:hypothetical protein H2198_008374 [Neophaeococcomyces mojaviensis]|uniref:Uncharacterized protein n=1 Tax=Neophaeococcomyces mojaviensis TaxID=3383035 RepID=A0ACC2ZXB7_9EURO|nr:hypothetical protein H2198_008374 [Knufia sp. JES_112]